MNSVNSVATQYSDGGGRPRPPLNRNPAFPPSLPPHNKAFDVRVTRRDPEGDRREEEQAATDFYLPTVSSARMMMRHQNSLHRRPAFRQQPMMAAAGARQNMAPELNPHDECGDLSGEFDARCRISVHYASTPTAMGGDNNGKRANSVEENSVTSSDEYDITSNSSTTSNGGLHVTSLNIGVGGVICQSPSSVTSDYHSTSMASTASTASTLYNSPQRLRLMNPAVARSSASLATVYKSPHPPPVPPKPRNKQQSVAKLNLSAENRPSVNYSRQERQKVEEEREHQNSVVTEDGDGEGDEEDRLSVTEGDVRAIEACFRGHRTAVFVCRCMANLYTCPRSSTRVAPAAPCSEWTLAYTGVPVLLLDGGNTKSRLKRQIQILLVEKGTCFALWKDVIDNLSKYTSQDQLFHVMHISTDHLCRVGLSFDDAAAAEEFFSRVQSLTADPENIALSGPRGKSRLSYEKEKRRRSDMARQNRKYRRPSKAEISQPCAFEHVVSVDRSDGEKYYSLQAYVTSGSSERKSTSDLASEAESMTEAGGATTTTTRWGSSPALNANRISVFESEFMC